MPLFAAAMRLLQLVTPGTPATGSNNLYPKSDDRLYIQNSAGAEQLIGPIVQGAGLALTGNVMSIAAGGVTSNMLQDNEIQSNDINTLFKDGLPAVPSMRTLGTSSQQAAAGDHTHTGLAPALNIKDEGTLITASPTGLNFAGAGVAVAGTPEPTITITGTPLGTASGDLSGNYPNPAVVKSTGNFTVGGTLTVSGAGGISVTNAAAPITMAGGQLNTGGGAVVTAGGNLTLNGGNINTNAAAFNINLSNGLLNVRGGSNIRGGIQGDTTPGVFWTAGSIVIGTNGYNATAPAAGNTQSLYANDIHSTANGLFMDDLSGGGSTGATVGNAGRITRTSSETMKEAVEPMTWDEANTVLGLESYTFRFKPDSDQSPGDPRRYPGFVAEQAAEAGAELWVGRQHKVDRDSETGEVTITRDEQGEIIYFRTADITVAHNMIIKKQQEQIEALERRLAAVEEVVAGLQT